MERRVLERPANLSRSGRPRLESAKDDLRTRKFVCRCVWTVPLRLIFFRFLRSGSVIANEGGDPVCLLEETVSLRGTERSLDWREKN